MLGFVFQPTSSFFKGLYAIIISPSLLYTDYMAVGGVGAALFNAGLVLLFTVYFSQKAGARLTGILIAALGMVAGFSLFGKNLLNSFPLIIGVVLYLKQHELRLANYMHLVCFSTGMAPLVSYLFFATNLKSPLAFLLGLAIGILVGYLVIPVSENILQIHQGFNLYNVGFSLGLISLTLIGVLRMFQFEVANVMILYQGEDSKFYWLLFILSFLFLLLGIWLNNGLGGYVKLLKSSGQLISDYSLEFSKAIVLINMGLVGLVCLVYLKLSGVGLNGPVIGAVISVIGFAAFGKHPRNIAPILIGVLLANYFNIHDMSSTPSALIALFGTTLAPIAGKYGIVVGIFAGFIHAGTALNVGFLHGGVNLYNNGMAGGFVATLLVPILNTWTERRKILATRNHKS